MCVCVCVSCWYVCEVLCRQAHLADALRRAGHRVVHAVVLADGPPQLCVGAVLLQRVGAFVPEVVVDRRVPHRAVVHVDLPRQVLERPGRRDTGCFTCSFYFFMCLLSFTLSALHLDSVTPETETVSSSGINQVFLILMFNVYIFSQYQCNNIWLSVFKREYSFI